MVSEGGIKKAAEWLLFLFGSGSLEFLQVVGGRLVNIVVEPVGVQEVGVGAPVDDGGLGVVVVGEIVGGDLWVNACGFVAQVFFLEGVAVVFGMAGDEDLSSAVGDDEVDAGLGGGGQDLQVGIALNVIAMDGGVAGVGGVEDVVKTA